MFGNNTQNLPPRGQPGHDGQFRSPGRSEVYHDELIDMSEDEWGWEHPPAFLNTQELVEFWTKVDIPSSAVSHIEAGLQNIYDREYKQHIAQFSVNNPPPQPSGLGDLRDDAVYHERMGQWKEACYNAYADKVEAGVAMPILEKRNFKSFVRIGLMAHCAASEPNFEWEDVEEVYAYEVRLPGRQKIKVGKVYTLFRFDRLDKRWLSSPESQTAAHLDAIHDGVFNQ